MTGLLSLLVTLVIVGLIFLLLFWFIGTVGLPEPFNKVAKVILGLTYGHSAEIPATLACG